MNSNDRGEGAASDKDKGLWRDLVAYFILGLCSNFGYVVMLSAALDIIGHFEGNTVSPSKTVSEKERVCFMVSTSAILLADILPSLILKLFIPFLPFWENVGVASAILCSAASFLLVGLGKFYWMAILGVASTSASAGIGESIFLSYSSMFNKNVISTWSSGTGAAGILGSLSYAMLLSFNVTIQNAMLTMLISPIIEGLTFWILLRKPRESIEILKAASNMALQDPDNVSFKNTKEKFYYLKHLAKYTVPISAAFFFIYIANQGLYELIHFENIFLDKEAQYRWLNVDYQFGVFVSRSSVNIVRIHRVWIMTVILGLCFIYFLTEAIFYYTPNIFILFVIVLWEGLLSGAVYVNTFYRIHKEIPLTKQAFALAIASQATCYGISLAGLLSMPIHNTICNLPRFER